jgi:hypothetical protein
MMLKNLSRAQEEGTAFRSISGGWDTWVVMVGQFTTSCRTVMKKLVRLLLDRVIEQGKLQLVPGNGTTRRHQARRDAANEDGDVVVTSRD